ncbi:MAG: ATP-binding cassette domain-containing protein, partial [Boseongicola sp. SB0670_bin_30]|nr:ATP-binding cassette domain-containing protein [Boseongicola sp. SB0670_bin_30]
MSALPILSVSDVTVEYQSQGIRFAAVSGINFDLDEGETLGLVGESGCGKSTIGRAILQLPRPTRGRVAFQSKELTKLSEREMRPVRRRLQVIFQDPVSSLNPRRKVRDIVAEPLDIAGFGTRNERYERVAEILTAVGMNPATTMDRRPHQFSGGQCQRICIARALIQEPKLIVCDEPVSSLDVSVQAQILNLLEDMKDQYGLTLLFISHDLAVVKNISDRVVVMYLGKFCELADSERIYEAPAHPYTAGLIASIPTIESGRIAHGEIALAGELPSPLDPPTGCRFRTRCPFARERCAREEPHLREIEARHH